MAKTTTDTERRLWAAVKFRILMVPQLLMVRPRCSQLGGETVRNMAPSKNVAGGNKDGN